MTPRRTELFALLVVCVGPVVAFAQPTGPQPWWPTQPRALPFVHPLFSDGCIIQRDIAAPVWGWSKPGDRVSVSVDGKASGEVAVAAADGRWSTKIGPFQAGGPHTIAIDCGTRKETLKDVLFGDVWLCSGQSNMNWPVRLANNAEEELKTAKHPHIRSFTVGFYPSLVPMQLPPAAKWEACTPENARNFTAVGYFFAREIHATQKVPIGIIHASVGATAAEAWVSGGALQRHMPFDFKDRLAELEKAAGPNTDYFAELEKWTATADPGNAKKYTSDADLNTSEWIDVAVPKPWGDAGLKDVHGLVWFRHTVNVPEKWEGKDISLSLSIINDSDVVWFNGTLIGATQTPGTGRTYSVDGKLVRAGNNFLTVAVVNKADPAGFCSNAANMVMRCPSLAAEPAVKLAGTWKAKPAVKLADLAPMPTPRVGHYKTITSFYNGMIAPLAPFAIKGALWYQGEANWPFWLQYRRLLPTLIEDWRERFGVGDFPFLVVSLAGYNAVQTKPTEPGWAEIRESQWRTVRRVPNTGLAMTIDIGDAKDIHPRNKQEAGRRLSLVARNLVYGEKELVCSGPEFTEMMIEPKQTDRIRLYFKHLGGGLMIRAGDKTLTGFAVAGADKNFVWAEAVIDGDTVVVSSPDVPAPKYVRYGWASNPLVNLYNKAGLPAIPFRTDE
ncbi:MAG: 9-O-acetylesterase [Planctomycetes bacterium]|nr:9-O-acetylesterase [Planctomycetota bacterium]